MACLTHNSVLWIRLPPNLSSFSAFLYPQVTLLGSFVGSYPGSSPALQLHLIHDDGCGIRLRKLRLSGVPGEMSMPGRRVCMMEFGSLDPGVFDLGGEKVGVAAVGGVEVREVDLGGMEVEVGDSGGVEVGVVELGGVPLGVVVGEGDLFGVVDLNSLNL